MAKIGFDATNVEPSVGFTALPVGDHLMMITDSEMRETKNKNGEGLNLTFTVLEGPHANQKAFLWLNLIHENTKAVEISQRILSAICHAVGKLKVDDSDELHDIPLIVTMTKDRNDPDRTVPSAFKAANSNPAVPAKVAAAKGVAAASSTPPWKRQAA